MILDITCQRICCLITFVLTAMMLRTLASNACKRSKVAMVERNSINLIRPPLLGNPPAGDWISMFDGHIAS